MPCHAEAALVGAGGDDLDDFAFAACERVFVVEFADFLVEGEGLGGVGECADEIGDEAVGFLRGFYAGFGGFGGGFYGVYG